MKKVVIQGLGYVGSAMAVAVASKEDLDDNKIFHVTGIDLPNKEGKKRINDINNGVFPFSAKDKNLSHELLKSVKNLPP